MTEQPDPQHLPVDYTNIVTDETPDVEVADDQTPEPDMGLETPAEEEV